MKYSETLLNELCHKDNFITKGHAPCTLLFVDKVVTITRIPNMRKLLQVQAVGGVVACWESARKLAFDLTLDEGYLIKSPLGSLFHPHDLPSWIEY